MSAVLLISFLGTMFLGTPIAISIALSSILTLEGFSSITPQFFGNGCHTHGVAGGEVARLRNSHKALTGFRKNFQTAV